MQRVLNLSIPFEIDYFYYIIDYCQHHIKESSTYF